MIQMEAKCEGTGGAPPVAVFHQTTLSPNKILNNNNNSSVIVISNNNNTNQTTQKNVKHTTTRERVQQAVEYYNSNVLRARIGAGLATTRNSVNEKHLLHGRSMVGNRFLPNPDNLYRSNSSLELLHENLIENHDNHIVVGGSASLRREYGSHGSIDVISSDRTPTTGESFFAMLQDYRPAVLGVSGTDQRSPGPSEYLKGKVIDPHNPNHHHHHNSDSVDKGSTGSPKLRMKLQRLWGPNKPAFKQGSQIPSLDDNNIPMNNYSALQCTSISAADIEERQRRRAFAHYDCQSLTANLGYAAKLRGLLLARRRNTTTGASAASMLSSRSATPDSGENGDEDYGDGHSNELLESCPFFRNEVGGEEEREVSLTRGNNQNSTNYQRRAIHRPVLSCGVSILECNHGEVLWKETTCPFQKGNRPIESVDLGAKYYRQYFLGQEHQNWFGMDEQLGPIAISVKREKLPESESVYQFRMIIRTSELLTLRGSIVEEAIPNPRGIGKPVTTKEVLEHVTPEVQINCLRLGNNTTQCEQQLLKLDEQGLTNKYKIGILYCKAGQSSEEDMYNNEEAGPAFEEFLNLIGKKVRLKGFEHYKAGLDNKTDSTGTHSLYTSYQDCEVMFHVSTMLPFTPNNRQQLLRKRHIGNDIVTIVFQEPGAQPFTPKNIRSQFQHVFIIVRVINPCTENTHYRVAVSRSKEVPVFGPPIHHNAHYPKGKGFAEFMLAKVINAENAAHRSEKFATMATRTRQEYLKDLCTNYITTQLVDTGQKFSIFANKKKEKPKIRFSGDSIQRGSFCWQVVLHDRGQSTAVDCFLGISAETFILIEESTRQIVFVTPCRSILGWSTNGNSLRIYHHQGEIVTIHMRDVSERDEQLEVIERLRAVTQGCGTIELNLRRNSLGQLGFHVQPDGVVTQVEISGLAWTAGLRQGYRLVEICKIAVVTLSHDQMVDLLKTSAQVTVTVIESFTDNTPRRGCFYPSCKFNMNNYESEYENLGNQTTDNTGGNVMKSPSKKMIAAAQLQPPGNHRRRYERNFSPPRSSNSSGYGTGSSSRSFVMPNEPLVNNNQTNMSYSNMGTLTSSSSGHSSNDERWYDVSEAPEYNTHTKVSHASNSLPLTVRPLSVHENKIPVTNVDQRPLPRTANIEYLIKCAPKRNEDDNNMDTVSNSTAQNEPIYSKFEEDDLTNAELLITMRSFQIQKNKQYQQSNSSSANSRNNSPRLNGEAKLRTTRANTAISQNQRNSVNYASSTFKEDLMKLINPDYMKVADDNFHQGAIKTTKPQKNSPNSHSLGNISNLSAAKPNIITDDLILLKKKSRSREGINLGHHPASLGNFNIPKMISDDFKTIEQAAVVGSSQGNEVIRATARPATIISINNNNNNNIQGDKNEVLHIKEENIRVSPKHHSSQQQGILTKQQVLENAEIMLNSKHMKNMNWNNLMEAESSLMAHDEEHLLKPIQNDIYESIGGTSSSSSPNPMNHIQKQHNHYEPPSSKSVSPSTTSTTSCNSNSSIFVPPSASLPELQSQVSQLEERVMMETKRRKSLESTVKRLTEENRRLQDESQAAVQQLRRFTEWFFQTIDRQS